MKIFHTLLAIMLLSSCTSSVKTKYDAWTEYLGGQIITKNDLLLIAGTKDGMFRAFNRFTGKLLWQTKLPAALFATPAMFQIDGKQYVVLACGGEKPGTPKGNQIMAFALE